MPRSHGDVSGLVDHMGAIADLDGDGVQPESLDRGPLLGPVLPGQDLLADLVGDLC